MLGMVVGRLAHRGSDAKIQCPVAETVSEAIVVLQNKVVAILEEFNIFDSFYYESIVELWAIAKGVDFDR